MDRNERKNSIIKAAVKVFSIKGFDKAKMVEIARQAEIGKGTIYEYFDSKKALFQEMVRYVVKQYCDGLEKIIFSEKSFRQKLLSCIEYQTSFLKENMDIMNIALESNTLSKDMRCWFLHEREVIFSLLEEMVAEGINNGELCKSLDKELAVQCIVGSINQYSTNSVFFTDTSPSSIKNNEFVNIILEGLANKD